MAKNRDSTKTDLSSFMCIILMLTGALITIMISNVVVISANPENVQITSVLPTGMDQDVFDFEGNKIKNPWYLEILRDRMVIHPGEEIVTIKDLESRDNGFERLLAKVEEKKDRQYIVMLVRPYGAGVARKIKRLILDRGVDIGVDLLDKDTPVQLMNSATNIASQAKG